MTGDGIKEFFEAVEASRDEYEKYAFRSSLTTNLFINPRREYLPELQRARAARDQSLQAVKDDSMNRLMKDLALDQDQNPALAQKWETEEDDEDDDDDLEMNLIDRCEFRSIFPHNTDPHECRYSGGALAG